MGRTTGLTSGSVIDSSATVQVAYESGLAVFTDVIIAQGDGVVKGVTADRQY
jgi:hypothetical protein